MLDEVQYAIADSELRGEEPSRLYGVLNGLLRMRNVDVYVTGSNSKLLSSDVMTQFRGRGDEVRVRPLSFSEFMQGFKGDKYDGWAEYVMFGGMPLILSMRTDWRTWAVAATTSNRRFTCSIPRRNDRRRRRFLRWRTVSKKSCLSATW